MKKIRYLVPIVATVALSGCMSAAEHRASVESSDDAMKITVGTVQKQIKKGMSAKDVAAVLGSPNIVTSENDGESWIYDKVSTDYAYSSSSGGVNALVFGVGTSTPAGIGGSGSASAGASTMTQRTLTIIITFKAGVVSDFSYHASKF